MDRLIRLGIPLLFYIFVIAPIINYVVRTNVWRFDGSIFRTFWANSIDYIKSYPDIGIDVGPLWFVETLLAFSILYGLYRLVTKSTPPPSRREVHAPSNLAIAVFALCVGLVSFMVRLWRPVGWEFRLLHLQFPHFPQYIAMLIVGIIAYRRNWLAGITDAMGKLWSRIALALIVLFPIVFVAGGALEGRQALFLGGFHWQSLAFSIWEQFMCVAMVISLMVWFRNRFNHQGFITRAMSAAAYATYIFHAPVIVLLAKSLRGISMDLALKFLWVAPIAVALSFFVGFIIKKLPLARSIL